MKIEIQRGSETIEIGDAPRKPDRCDHCFILDASVQEVDDNYRLCQDCRWLHFGD